MNCIPRPPRVPHELSKTRERREQRLGGQAAVKDEGFFRHQVPGIMNDFEARNIFINTLAIIFGVFFD